MTATPAAARRPQPCQPVDLRAVTPAGFLADLQQRNATATLPHVIEQLEASGVLENLRCASRERRHVGFQFSDSDLYKTLEAIGWEVARTGTTAFDGFLADAVDLLRAAQHEDGYLNSWGDSANSPGHFVDLTWGHELYCGGHLVQAAVALERVGRPELMTIARAWADLVVTHFADEGFCGHPVAETALVELYRQTGHRPYLDVAQAMVERRGRRQLPPKDFEDTYFQDHLPVREATEAVGHAVRQLYLDAGVADVAAETGDESLLPALVARWESAHDTKMYLTGAMGSRHRDESFGDPYELPPDRAYAETCAAIADLQSSWRLLLATGEPRYASAIERVVLNALPASLSADGTRFFYSNPLQLRSTHHAEPNAPSERVSWYPCACCPPNIARVMASLGGYLVSTSGDELTIWQPLSFDLDLPPSVGEGRLEVRRTDAGMAFRLAGSLHRDLRVRVPDWAGGGFASVALADGGAAELHWDDEPLFVTAHPRIDAARGCVAVVSGGTVWCAEEADNPGLEDLAVDPSVPPRRDGDRVAVSGVRMAVPTEPYLPWSARTGTSEDQVTVTLVPYRDWGNRGVGAMRVWLPVGTAL